MGGTGSAAHSRVHARDQTTATSRCQRLRFATGKCAHHLSLHRRGVWFERISMEPYVACSSGGEAGEATGEVDIHASTNVRFGWATRPDRTEVFHGRGERREAGGVASRHDHTFLTYSRVHRGMRQHVAHVVFVSECRGIAPAREAELNYAVSNARAWRH